MYFNHDRRYNHGYFSYDRVDWITSTNHSSNCTNKLSSAELKFCLFQDWLCIELLADKCSGHLLSLSSHEKYDFRRKFYLRWTGCIKEDYGRNGHFRTKDNLENSYRWFNIPFSKYRRFSLIIKFYIKLNIFLINIKIKIKGQYSYIQTYSGIKCLFYFFCFYWGLFHTADRSLWWCFMTWTYLCWVHRFRFHL